MLPIPVPLRRTWCLLPACRDLLSVGLGEHGACMGGPRAAPGSSLSSGGSVGRNNLWLCQRPPATLRTHLGLGAPTCRMHAGVPRLGHAVSRPCNWRGTTPFPCCLLLSLLQVRRPGRNVGSSNGEAVQQVLRLRQCCYGAPGWGGGEGGWGLLELCGLAGTTGCAMPHPWHDLLHAGDTALVMAQQQGG